MIAIVRFKVCKMCTPDQFPTHAINVGKPPTESDKNVYKFVFPVEESLVLAFARCLFCKLALVCSRIPREQGGYSYGYEEMPEVEVKINSSANLELAECDLKLKTFSNEE